MGERQEKLSFVVHRLGMRLTAAMRRYGHRELNSALTDQLWAEEGGRGAGVGRGKREKESCEA